VSSPLIRGVTSNEAFILLRHCSAPAYPTIASISSKYSWDIFQSLQFYKFSSRSATLFGVI
jgi:hypothetical protein